jgi:hypothetical protein
LGQQREIDIFRGALKINTQPETSVKSTSHS